MKKIFALILCLMLFCITTFGASATDYEIGDVFDGVVEEPSSEENYSTTTEETPTEEETMPPETNSESPIDDSAIDIKDTISGALKAWIEPNMEEIGVIITLVAYGIASFNKLKKVLTSMGVLNNNAITIAKDSKAGMNNAAEAINAASSAVIGYETQIKALLEAYKIKAEREAMLERELVEIKNYLKTSTDSNIEFANELADLIALANIPNYKKEELGSRHMTAVNALIGAEERAEIEAAAAAALLLPASTEEMKEDVGEEKKD
jgi:hypothetical protein